MLDHMYIILTTIVLIYILTEAYKFSLFKGTTRRNIQHLFKHQTRQEIEGQNIPIVIKNVFIVVNFSYIWDCTKFGIEYRGIIISLGPFHI